jgi:inner membrane protein
MAWWMWMVLGFVLLIAEMVTPGLFLLFFGFAGVAVGLLELLGVSGPPWTQWLLFSVIAIVSMLLFRKPLLARIKQRSGEDVDRLEAEIAVAMEDLATQQVGRVELRGSPWSAQNVGSTGILRGQRCRVERVEGLMLRVRAD